MNRIKKNKAAPRIRAICKTCGLLRHTMDAQRLQHLHSSLTGHEVTLVAAENVETTDEANRFSFIRACMSSSTDDVFR